MFETTESVRDCFVRDWSPVIGDPHVTGWLTVGAYLACFILALKVQRRQSSEKARGLWIGIAVLTLFLAVNKQLDLQTALTAFGRCLAHAQGWWEDRQTVQVAAIFALMFLLSALMGRVIATMRHQLNQQALALAGLTILCCFVSLRAVGFHVTDSLIRMEFAGVSINFILENSGLALIALNAITLLRQPGPGVGRAGRQGPGAGI